jgi:hypothetical protein
LDTEVEKRIKIKFFNSGHWNLAWYGESCHKTRGIIAEKDTLLSLSKLSYIYLLAAYSYISPSNAR